MPRASFPNLTVLTHPLIAHKLSILRDRDTSTRDFKQLVGEIATLMAYEVTKDLPTEPVEIETPLERMTGQQVSGKKLTLVPILRAGLGMVDGIAQLIPSARVGHIGLYRDHDTLKPVDYYFKIPATEVERDFFVLDPMLATGGSAVAAVSALHEAGARRIKFLCLVAAPEGRARGCSRRTPTSPSSPPRSTASSTSTATSSPASATPATGCSAPDEDPVIRLSFYGAAGQVTGSMHLLEAAGARFLLDAGLFQGHRAEARELNLRLPFDPRRLDGIVLSHAHIDHSGRLPLLVGHGFHGPIYATPATRDLCAVMLADAAHIQEKDFEFLQRRDKAGAQSEPLYSLADAVATQDLMVGVPYRRITHLRKHLALEFLDAGHILGSASVDIRITEAREPPPGVLRRHRPERAPDRPRSRPAFRAGRHADRRGHLRGPEPRVGGRRRGAAGRGGAPGRRARAARC